MSRDLFPEVETIISSSNPYIRRKAALCAMRICRKAPDLQEHFLDKAKLLLNDRNHGVLLCGLTLVTSLCEADEAEDGENGVVDVFRPVVPQIVKILKSLASAGYTPEHDVNGISDPFLQVKILRLLRVLARGDSETSELINDILAQVSSNWPRQLSCVLITKRLLPTPMDLKMLETPFFMKPFLPFSTLRLIPL
jgi:AP-1 complex subunit gamma-1